MWISYRVAILLPCLNIRDKRGDVLSALFLESVNGVLNSEQSNRRCWKTASGLPWSHKAHLPPENRTFENWSLEPLIFQWLRSIFLIAQLIHFGGKYLLSTNTVQKLNISPSAMPLSSGSFHSTKGRQVIHATMVTVFGERGRTGYFQYCTTGLRESRDSIPKKISFSSYKFNSHKDTIYIILICQEIKAFNVFIFKGSLHLQALIRKP